MNTAATQGFSLMLMSLLAPSHPLLPVPLPPASAPPSTSLSEVGCRSRRARSCWCQAYAAATAALGVSAALGVTEWMSGRGPRVSIR